MRALGSGLGWVAVVLPSLALAYPLLLDGKCLPVHREAFGNGDYYLEVAYRINPRGVLAGDSFESPFQGLLTGPRGEVPVEGALRREGSEEVYRFRLPGGSHFVGRLRRDGACDRQLTYRLIGPGGRNERGVLSAGFCP